MKNKTEETWDAVCNVVGEIVLWVVIGTVCTAAVIGLIGGIMYAFAPTKANQSSIDNINRALTSSSISQPAYHWVANTNGYMTLECW